jgi:hypothetical protein
MSLIFKEIIQVKGKALLVVTHNENDCMGKYICFAPGWRRRRNKWSVDGC